MTSASSLMSPRGALPPELVDQVIDELGEAYHRPVQLYRRGACAALRACSLVSRRWNARSRVHLFKRIEIDGDEDEPIATPPTSILPHVKELVLNLYGGNPEPIPIRYLLNAFITAPIYFLGIVGASLDDKRACIRERIDVHSATLRKVEFKDCYLSTHNIADIALGSHRLTTLRLVGCAHERPPSPGQQSLITDDKTLSPRSKPSGVELRISLGDNLEDFVSITAMAARLPHHFSKLDVDHIADKEKAVEATNALIKANGDVLSLLRIRINAGEMDFDLEPGPLLCLKECLNLSELALDMRFSYSCAIQYPALVLSTLDPARSSRLGKIVLISRLCELFNEDGLVDGGDGQDRRWGKLDVVLSELARVHVCKREKWLSFTLTGPGDDKLVLTARMWLPKLLPRFSEQGLFHVHCW